MQVNLEKWFVEHPRSVNETYLQHFAMASRFAWLLLVASMRCLVHARIPFLCERAASESVHKLSDDMGKNRVQRQTSATKSAEPAWP